MQLVDQPGALGDHVVAALVEQREHGGEIFGGDRIGVTLQCRDTCCGGGDDVVLAPAAAGELTNAGRRAREGTSSTDSPRAASHCARCRPSPQAFSTAHRRSSKLAAHVSSRRYPVSDASICSAASTVLRPGSTAETGVRPFVGIDSDDDHALNLSSDSTGTGTMVDTPTSNSGDDLSSVESDHDRGAGSSPNPGSNWPPVPRISYKSAVQGAR